MKKNWIDKDVTILGFSLSGIASAEYLAKKGANCTISEKREQKPEDRKKIEELEKLGIRVEMGEHKEESILNADLIISSPGIPPHAEVLKIAKSNNIQVISEIELAFFETKTPFIAITGTNGKTTTTKLVSEILTNAGYNAPFCGNIGIPVVGLLEEKIDYFVLEISSYQIDTSKTFKPQIAAFLNYTPDHIDWHGSEEAYYQAKTSLFTDYRSPSWVVLNACDPKVMGIKSQSFSKIIPFGREMPNQCVYINENKIVYKNKNRIENVIEINKIPLIGKHNLQNIMAAISIAKIVGVENEVIKNTISSFKPPEHRLEYVDTIENIPYYNDSKATNCDSTICALKAFEDEKVVLIAGGKDKGTDLTELIQTIKDYASYVILIGEAADRFEAALISAGYNNIQRAKTLEEAIDAAGNLKQGPVLFAPACASFDMFKNFEERGQVFKDYVNKKKTFSPA